jgi:hypothetical protein
MLGMIITLNGREVAWYSTYLFLFKEINLHKKRKNE